MPSWSTHDIEIEEMQCFWNMLNPDYKDRTKKSDAGLNKIKVSEVLDRDQMERSFYSLFSNN